MDADNNPAQVEHAKATLASGTDPVTGFATDGDWPINSRLRAEAMAKQGVKSDPGGLIGDDLIAATAERLDAEAKEAARIAKETPSLDWSAAKLRTHAEGLGLPIETDANKAAILAAIEAAPAVHGTEG